MTPYDEFALFKALFPDYALKMKQMTTDPNKKHSIIMTMVDGTKLYFSFELKGRRKIWSLSNEDRRN